MLSRPEKRSFKKVHKIEIFRKGLVHGFRQKNQTFYHLCILGKSSKERSFFLLFWIKKSKKVQKFEIFQKGQSIWFLSKNRTFCHLCLLGKSSQKRSFFGILDKKECFLDQKKEVLKNDKKSKFSKGVSQYMVFVKKSNFLSSVFFWANQARQDRFGLLDKKECSLKQKKLKNFPKGLVHGFCQKIELPLVY